MIFDTPENSALSGNRTPVSRVAGENSTTEPTMRGNLGFLEGPGCHGANMKLSFNTNFCPKCVDGLKDAMSTLSIKMKAFCKLSRPVSSVG